MARRNRENNANRLDVSDDERIAMAKQLIAVGMELLTCVESMEGDMNPYYFNERNEFCKDKERQRVRNAICWKASRIEQIAYRLRIDAGIWSDKRKLV